MPTCVVCVERGKREGAFFSARLNSVAEHKENVGRAEWTPRLGEWSCDLKYVV